MKSEIFRLAHKIAKTLEGDYQARISFALKTVYDGMRGEVTELFSENFNRFNNKHIIISYSCLKSTLEQRGIEAANETKIKAVSDKQRAYAEKKRVEKIEAAAWMVAKGIMLGWDDQYTQDMKLGFEYGIVKESAKFWLDYALDAAIIKFADKQLKKRNEVKAA